MFYMNTPFDSEDLVEVTPFYFFVFFNTEQCTIRKVERAFRFEEMRDEIASKMIIEHAAGRLPRWFEVG